MFVIDPALFLPSKPLSVPSGARATHQQPLAIIERIELVAECTVSIYGCLECAYCLAFY